MKTKALILLAHPDPREPNLNRHLALQAANLSPVTIRDLYQAYPDGKIDVGYEQSLLLDHSVVIFQFPLYWYSTPPLLKTWQDEVLLWNFAFGPEGDKLHGKKFMISLTAGGLENEFHAGEKHGYTLSEFLIPIEHTMRYCGMTVEKPFIMYGANKTNDAEVAQRAKEYSLRVASLLK